MLESYGLQFCGDKKAFSFGNYGASFLSADKAEEDEKERTNTVPVEIPEPNWTPIQLKELAEFDGEQVKYSHLHKYFAF